MAELIRNMTPSNRHVWKTTLRGNLSTTLEHSNWRTTVRLKKDLQRLPFQRALSLHVTC